MTIDGKTFPRNTTGFIRFDYLEVFRELPWTETKSFWEEVPGGKVEINWECGGVEDINGYRDLCYVNTSYLHKKWKRLGYLPGKWRVGEIFIHEDEPVGKDIKRDVWPRMPMELSKEGFYLTYYGKLQVHEFYKAVPDKNDYETQFKVFPTPETQICEYFPLYDVTSKFTKEGEEWITL